jgi:hypothetical protein
MTYGDFLRWISRGLLDRLPRVCHFGTLLAGSIPSGHWTCHTDGCFSGRLVGSYDLGDLDPNPGKRGGSPILAAFF